MRTPVAKRTGYAPLRPVRRPAIGGGLGGLLILLTLLLAAPRPAPAQIPGAERPLEALLGEPPRLEVRPSLSVLRCCSGEQRLDLAVRWPQDVTGEWLRLGLVGGVTRTGAEVYSRSGVEVRMVRGLGALELTGDVGVGIGRGNGPRSMLSMTFGAGLPAVALDVRTTWFQDAPVDSALREPPPEPFPGGGASLTDGRYSEAELQARHRIRGVGLQVTGGMLFGGHEGWTPHWLWGEIDVPLRRRLGLVLAGGQRPDRRELSQVGGPFAQLSVRWNLHGPEPELPADAREPEDDDVTPLEVTRLAATRYRLRLRVSGARSVELKGDVTDWEVLVMRRAGGRSDDWEAVLDKPAGLYHVNIRVDGGAWTVPPGTVAVPDRFGGSIGLLTLPTEEDVNDGNG